MPETQELEKKAAEPKAETVEEVVDEAAAVAEEPKKKGTELLDFDKLPAEIVAVVKPRFDRIYANMKDGNRRADMLEGQNAKLMAAFEATQAELAGYKAGLVSKDADERVGVIKTKIKDALVAGQADVVAELTEQMADAKAEQKLAKLTPERPKTVTVPSGGETALDAWASERNESGDFRRPWAQNGHPRQKEMAAYVMSVMESPEFVGKPITEVLAEVDRRVAPTASRTVTAAVLPGSNGSGRPKPDGLPKLGPDQQYVAEKMFPKLAAKDAHSRYAKQLQAIGKAP